jgi:hypothetical protein
VLVLVPTKKRYTVKDNALMAGDATVDYRY